MTIDSAMEKALLLDVKSEKVMSNDVTILQKQCILFFCLGGY